MFGPCMYVRFIVARYNLLKVACGTPRCASGLATGPRKYRCFLTLVALVVLADSQGEAWARFVASMDVLLADTEVHNAFSWTALDHRDIPEPFAVHFGIKLSKSPVDPMVVGARAGGVSRKAF